MTIPVKTKPIISQPLLNSIPDNLVGRFDPVYLEYYNRYNVGRFHTHQVPIEDFRANPAKYTTSYGRAIAGDVFRVTDQQCPVEGGEITVRIYEPDSALSKGKPCSAYVNYHGGGWVFNGLEHDEEWCKRVVNALGCVVFDVDYRLAPENKFPVPVDDSWTAFNWVRKCARPWIHTAN